MILYIRYCTGKIEILTVSSVSVGAPDPEGIVEVTATAARDGRPLCVHPVCPGGAINVSDAGHICLNLEVKSEKMRVADRIRPLVERLDSEDMEVLRLLLAGAPCSRRSETDLVVLVMREMKKYGLVMVDVL